MFWLAQFEDLNPIEPVWDELDQKIRVKQPTNAAHLWQILLESWVELLSVHLLSFVETMPRIYEAVIVVKEVIWIYQKLKKFFLIL